MNVRRSRMGAFSPSDALYSNGGSSSGGGSGGGGVENSPGTASLDTSTPPSTVRGVPPEGRLAHSAALVRVAEGEGGTTTGKQALMVVFGGVGTGALFNDVHILRCSSTSSLEWQRVSVRGRKPAKRYGHSMVALRSPSPTCAYAKMVVFGGTAGHNAFDDMFVLSISWGRVEGVYGFVAEWESLATLTEGPMPCPRSRQTICEMNGELIIFGGSDETPATNNAHPTSREVDAFVYHIRPRMRKIPFPPGAEDPDPFRKYARFEPSATRVGGGGLRRWHERSMAREVTALEGLVQAAEERRVRAEETFLVGAAAGTGVGAGEATGRAVNGRRSARAGGAVSPVGLQQGARASGPVVSGVVGGLMWECIRPEAFVYEPGPEPAVIVRPMTLHKDMQTLIGSKKFSDIKFRFQAVNFALPTTPTNTAHYAIVPPPTPTLCPSRGASSSSAPPGGNRASSSQAAGTAGHWSNAGATSSGDCTAAAAAAASRDYARSASSLPVPPSSPSPSAAAVVRCSAGGVVGDEEGLSAKESRSARRAHRSALLNVPTSILSPTPHARRATNVNACSGRGSGCLGVVRSGGGDGGGGGGGDGGARGGSGGGGSRPDGAAPHGSSLTTELTLPVKRPPLDASSSPPTPPRSRGRQALRATGDDRLLVEDCSKRGDCRPRKNTAAPPSVLPPYDQKPAASAPPPVLPPRDEKPTAVSCGSAGDTSGVTDMDTASCGRMCTLWPLPTAKQGAEARAGAGAGPGVGAEQGVGTGVGGGAETGQSKVAFCRAQTSSGAAKVQKGCDGGSAESGGLGKLQTVAMRSSAGREFASLR
eukprot:jgi/Undpi1/11855/HiC_scaffold_4.g01554.m1